MKRASTGRKSAKNPAAVVREWFEKVWNRADEPTIGRLCHPKAVIYGLIGSAPEGTGVDGFRQFWQEFRGAFPDVKITVEQTVTQGNWVAARCVVTGTHTGRGLGMLPTREKIRFEGMVLARVVGGTLRVGRNFFDLPRFYQQLGISPN